MLIAKTDQSFGNKDGHELMNSKTETIASYVVPLRQMVRHQAMKESVRWKMHVQ
jgi:hypothetical protein